MLKKSNEVWNELRKTGSPIRVSKLLISKSLKTPSLIEVVGSLQNSLKKQQAKKIT